MSDLANGIVYLCSSCCCWRDTDLPADGSRINSRGKAHPAERQIDEEFMSRNYRRDATGRLHTQPTPTSSMFPRQTSDQSKTSSKTPDTKEGVELGYMRQELDQKAVPVVEENSTSQTESPDILQGSRDPVNSSPLDEG